MRSCRGRMSEDVYKAWILDAGAARAAFPLISLEHPDLTFRLWHDFVRSANRGPRHRKGLVAIGDRRGTIHAVFSYEVCESLSASTALRVRDVVMGRLPGGTLPRAALSCIARLAGEFASSTVQIDFLDGALSPHDRALLAESGFRPSGTMFSRTVAPNAPLNRDCADGERIT